MEFLKTLFMTAFYITGIIAVLALSASIIMGFIDTLINRAKKRKAEKELKEQFDKLAEDIIKMIEEEEAKKAVKETKKTKKTVKKEEK